MTRMPSNESREGGVENNAMSNMIAYTTCQARVSALAVDISVV